MSGPRSEERTGVVLVLAAALLWGTSWVATDYALQGFSPLAVAAWRGIGGLVLMMALLHVRPSALRGQPIGPRRSRLLRLAVLGALGGAAFQVGMVYAVNLSGATVAAFVAGLYPLLVAAGGGLVLGERPTGLVVGGVAVAFLGVILLAGFDPIGTPPIGLAIGLASAAAFAAYLLLARRWAGPWGLSSPLVVTAVMLVTTAVTVPLALLTDPLGLVPAGPVLVVVAAVLWLAGPVGAVAQAAAVGGVRRLPSSQSAALMLLNPLTAAVLAAVLLTERLGPLQLAGCVLVLAGMALATVLAPARHLRGGMPGPLATGGGPPAAYPVGDPTSAPGG